MGATVGAGVSPAKRRVSIHAPVMGATYSIKRGVNFIPSFNPRARDGRDL